MRTLMLAIICVALAFAVPCWAAPPRTLSYQGALTDENGTVLNGAYELIFSLYDAPQSGTLLWSETQTVAVNAGVFSVVLGEIIPLDISFDAPYWIGLAIAGNDEMTPRTPLTAAPYALRSITTDNVELQSEGSFYRWTVFNSYAHGAGWMGKNNSQLYGGITSESWSTERPTADQISSDKELLRTLFTRKGYGGTMANVYSEKFIVRQGAEVRWVTVLFRIRNNTASNITWPLEFCYTSDNFNGDASVALNGSHIWDSTGLSGQRTGSVSLSIPGNRTSTVIVVGASSPMSGVSSSYLHSACCLAFINDSLALPDGLEYIDDLDTATGGWEQ